MQYKFNNPYLIKTLLLLFISILFINFASASQISLVQNYEIDDNNFNLILENRGSSSAHNVFVEINVSNNNFKSEKINILRNNEKTKFSFDLHKLNFNESNLILIKIHYTDQNNYAFSIPNVIIYENNEIKTQNKIENVFNLNLRKNINLNFNQYNKEYYIFVPDEININNNLIQSDNKGNLNFRLSKGSALTGSVYPIYVIDLENDEIFLFHISIGEINKLYYFIPILILILLIYFLFNYYINNFKKNKKLIYSKYIEIGFDILIILTVFVFLLFYFKPNLIFSSTITAGGDTASHYLTIDYFIENLFPFKTSGWDMGNYAGFPLLEFYFPLPFILMAILSYFFSIQISFKLITILGIFLLPLAVYIMARLMKLKSPAPILASISTLVFLFMEANSMWGANIPSTLAGEFSYSIAFALCFIFFGTLYKGIKEKRYYVLNSVLIFVIGITHLYGLIFVALASLYFIYNKENLDYLIKIGLAGFFLLGFWMLPMLKNLSYTTAYGDAWVINFSNVFPIIILPYILLIILFVFSFKEFILKNKFRFLVFSLISTSLLYLIAPFIGLVDIRFVPFIQFVLILLGVFALSNLILKLFNYLKLNNAFKNNLIKIFIVIFFIFTIVHVENNVEYIDNWIKWNYEGFENKNSYELFNDINQYLKHEETNSRVVYEHSQLNNQFGTTRAFEMLPFFANRSTLEGLYMQSSISAPFVFYIQALISQQKSCPFPNFGCTSTDFNRAERRLQMFNVGSLIIVSENSKNLISRNEFYNKSAKFNNYEIYNIEEKGYVYVPEYRPILYETKDKQLSSYLWFINDSLIDVHYVFDENILLEDDNIKDYFVKEELNNDCNIEYNLSNEQISFYTDCVGKPHIISVSYYPKLKSLNSENIYYVSPSFMLIYPKENYVEINYERNLFDYLGLIFSLLGILFIYYLFLFSNKLFIQNNKQYLIILIILFLFAILFSIYIFNSLNANNELVYDIALATNSYVVCDHTFNLREKCLIDVAIKNNDANICTRTKDIDNCYYEYVKQKKDFNVCRLIKDNKVEQKCMNLQ